MLGLDQFGSHSIFRRWKLPVLRLNASRREGRIASGIARRSRIEYIGHLLISLVCRKRFLPVLAERFHDRRVLNGEKDCSFCGGTIDVFVVSPAGNGENVALFPIKTDSSDYSSAASFKHVVNGAIHLAMRLGVRT